MLKDTPKILSTLHHFTPISLNEMDEVKLMKRTDTKFVLHRNQLAKILEDIKDDYSVLVINNKRIANYKSLYFDTSANDFYFDHHRGKSKRLKIRMRKYVDSELCFLEIKQKDTKGNTIKNRVKISDFEETISLSSKQYIEEVTAFKKNLNVSLWNSFQRITLVNKNIKERVTIDVNLQYELKDNKIQHNDLIIIEIKQEKFDRTSKMVKTLKKNSLHPYSISKYCMGMIYMNKDLKYNNFKQKLLRVKKIIS